jgi:cysteinyl-tRNA synthetase
LADDLNFAKAIGIIWQITKSSELNNRTKLALILDFDKVLGLQLNKTNKATSQNELKIPEEILKLKNERDLAREQKNWQKSDDLRKQIELAGFILEDKNNESIIRKKY